MRFINTIFPRILPVTNHRHQSRASTRSPRIGASSFIRLYFSRLSSIFFDTYLQSRPRHAIRAVVVLLFYNFSKINNSLTLYALRSFKYRLFVKILTNYTFSIIIVSIITSLTGLSALPTSTFAILSTISKPSTT